MKTISYLKEINKACTNISKIASPSPLEENERLSSRYGAQKVFLKREDLSKVRSFKLRGAYNKMCSLTSQQKARGVVCASAGNHAQGVALSCTILKIKGTIYMPVGTPLQKIDRVKHFANGMADIKLYGDTYDEACHKAQEVAHKRGAVFVHAFNDPLVIAGQGTIGKEILDQLKIDIDVVVVPVGGGGLISGIAAYIKEVSPATIIIGAEAEGSASMYASLKQNKIVELSSIDTFADGVAVKKVGEHTFSLVKKYVHSIVKVPEGKIAKSMIELYQNEGIVTEPAGALSIAALSSLRSSIKDKNVVCIVSGGNNDILRYGEILEKSLVYQGRKHYFIIEFAQKPGQLKKFVNNVLGPTDDIVRFEYIKKTNTENGPALVGIEQESRDDYKKLIKNMEKFNIRYIEIHPTDLLYRYII